MFKCLIFITYFLHTQHFLSTPCKFTFLFIQILLPPHSISLYSIILSATDVIIVIIDRLTPKFDHQQTFYNVFVNIPILFFVSHRFDRNYPEILEPEKVSML